MSRFPPTPVSEYSAELKPYAEALTKTVEQSFGKNGDTFVYKESNGALLGPFPFLIESKDTGTAVQGLLKAIGQYKTLPIDAREVAILVTGARFQAAFELYSHTHIAIKKAGLKQEQVDLIISGKKPNDLNETCNIVYDAAYHLAFEKGPLPQALWDRSIKLLGKEGTLGMIHNVGLYAYVCVMLNAADTGAPSE